MTHPKKQNMVGRITKRNDAGLTREVAFFSFFHLASFRAGVPSSSKLDANAAAW